MDAVVAFIANGEGTKPVEPASVRSTTQRNTPRPPHLDALVADAAGGRADGPTSCRATVATIRNHIVIASPPAALLRSSAVAARPRQMLSLTFAAVTCATSAPRAHRSRCGVWTPPCGDRLGSVQFFSPAHRADRPAVHHRPALVEPSPSALGGHLARRLGSLLRHLVCKRLPRLFSRSPQTPYSGQAKTRHAERRIRQLDGSILEGFGASRRAWLGVRAVGNSWTEERPARSSRREESAVRCAHAVLLLRWLGHLKCTRWSEDKQ